MALQLSEGCLSAIMRGETVEHPVLQILGNKKIVNNGATERYRLLVSDGSHLNSFAMLATQLNSRLTSGELSDYSVVKVDRFITSLVNSDKGNKRVMIILELTVLAAGSEVGIKLGDPVPLVEGGGDQSKAVTKPAVANNSPSSVSNNTARPMPAKIPSASPIDTMHTYPIANLNPYQNRWVIRARVTNKSAVRTWSNARGEGKLFSMDLLDESGDIRATVFRDQVDTFYDVIEVNNVYFISRCQLKPANKKFTNCKHDYEIVFTTETQVIPCHDDAGDIPALQFDFTRLVDITNMEANAIIDVIGVAKSAGELISLVARTTNKELKKRDVLIVDNTQTGVNITFWGTDAETFDASKNPVIAVKGGRINEFGGSKSVSLAMSSVMQLNPDIPEAHHLRGWYDSGGCDADVKLISGSGSGVNSLKGGPWMTLQEVKTKRLGFGEKPDYFNCKATIILIKSENSIYKACPSVACNKKVVEMQNSQYRCEKCGQDFPEFKYRLLINASIADWSGKQWVSAFQDAAEVILGTTADELGRKMNEPENYVEAFTAATFKSYVFRLRVKSETYNDENRVKTVIMSVVPINYKDYSSYLLKKIKEKAGISKDHSS